MNEHVLIALKKHIQNILDFATGKTKEYVYHNLLNDEKITFKDLKGFPCEMFLLLSNKALCRKYVQGTKIVTDKSQLNHELLVFIFNSNTEWEHFTGDHCHPVPSKLNIDYSLYNSGLVHQQAKAAGSLWLKDYGSARINYLQYLLLTIEASLAEE